jgi:hypothetical protein
VPYGTPYPCPTAGTVRVKWLASLASNGALHPRPKARFVRVQPQAPRASKDAHRFALNGTPCLRSTARFAFARRRASSTCDGASPAFNDAPRLRPTTSLVRAQQRALSTPNGRTPGSRPTAHSLPSTTSFTRPLFCFVVRHRVSAPERCVPRPAPVEAMTCWIEHYSPLDNSFAFVRGATSRRASRPPTHSCASTLSEHRG